MALHPGTMDIMGSVADAHMVSTPEDMAKKVRKPYTITKSRESWTKQEHEKFLEALQLFDRDWKKIEAFVGTKTVIQIRSHAQKYFLKVQKNGTGEHVPPPRPKRKSAQPYPHKAAKTAPAPEITSSISIAEPAYSVALPPCTTPPVLSAAAMPAWVHHMAPTSSCDVVHKGTVASGIRCMGSTPCNDQVGMKIDNSSISSQQLPEMSQRTANIILRVIPEFTEVYSFLGNVFDPAANGHLQRMREMAPIDKETVLLLMKNLSINLSSADFEEHKLFLSVPDVEVEDPLPAVGSDVKSPLEAPILAVQSACGW